jgi:hemolysin III
MAVQTKPLIKMESKNPYTPQEEALNTISHGIGVVLGLVWLIILVRRSVQFGDSLQIASFSIYGVSLILLYTASSLYHGLRNPRLKRFFKVMDHVNIYLLIAGSYTPFLLVGIQTQSSKVLFYVIWGLALAGILFKVLFIQRFQKASVGVYVLMGWLSVVMIKEMIANIPLGGLIWLGAGGVAYTVGVIFYSMKKVPYMHFIWHLFVLTGSICHYIGILTYLAPGG